MSDHETNSTSRTMIALMFGAFGILAAVGCDKRDGNSGSKFSESKTHQAEDTAKKYAYEAYPSWSQAHPDKACPAELADLNEYMNNKDIKDPWGHDYLLFCGPNLPAGAKGLAVMSLGEDGKNGTADDIKSW
jgi:hypothetical protein